MLMGLKAAGSPIDTSVSVTVTSCIIPILVGVVVTTLAALPPARRATKVTPVVALQPVTETPLARLDGSASGSERCSSSLVLPLSSPAQRAIWRRRTP